MPFAKTHIASRKRVSSVDYLLTKRITCLVLRWPSIRRTQIIVEAEGL